MHTGILKWANLTSSPADMNIVDFREDPLNTELLLLPLAYSLKNI